MPVDLLAVNAGISPQLTSGQPTPPLDASHQLAISASYVDNLDQQSRSSNDGDASTSGSRDVSQSRKPTTAPNDKKASIPPATGASTNLVTKDAVVAATVLTDLVKPNRASVMMGGGLQLLVLGVPTVGAKSRVETQIKISLVLVGMKAGGEGKAKKEKLDAERFMTHDGGLEGRAGDEYERIGSWSHVKLPKFLALKKKTKKQVKPGTFSSFFSFFSPLANGPPLNQDPLPEDTLFLDVAVVRGSEPYEEISICAGCQQREHKRAQRKKDARVRPVDEVDGVNAADEEEEKRKVVVFNCSEFVEFGSGETVLPTRITCYCRHHKERKGFS